MDIFTSVALVFTFFTFFTFFMLIVFSLTGVIIKNKYLRIFLTIVSLVIIVFVITGYKGAEYYGDYGYCEFNCGDTF